MAAARRLAALVVGVMMLALVLVESGFACAMPEMAEMPEMAMPDGTAPAPDDTESPCRFPWAPSGCRDMAPCAPAALVVATWQPQGRAPAHHAWWASPVLAPPSFDTPPEPPPPRA